MLNENVSALWLGLLIYSIGVFLAITAKKYLGNNWGVPLSENVQLESLVLTGPYTWTRNPIYLSEMLQLIGFELVLGSWLLVLVIPFFYFNYKKAVFEEKLLLETFGEAYKQYMKSTPRFI